MSEEGFDIVKPKMLSALCDRLKSRLTPALVGIYTQGYDASDSAAAATPGMLCLENLRASSKLLHGVQDS